jgi:hypothetical protein
MDAVLKKISEEGGSPLEMLRKALLMYVSFGLANPEHYRVAFFTSPVIYGSPQEYLERDTISRRAYFRYRDLVGECCTAGQLPPTDADLLAQTLWSGLHGVIAAAIYAQDFPLVEPEQLAQTMIEGLLKGFRK